MNKYKWIPFLILSISYTFGFDKLTENNREASNKLYNSGRTQTTIGQFMIVGGWLATFIGSNSLGNSWDANKVPVSMIIGGTISMNAGFPVLGYGADKIGRSNSISDSNSYIDESGWGMYKTSITMGLLGMGLIVVGASTVSEGQEGISPLVIGSVFLGIGSAICGVISWIQFIKRASRESKIHRELYSSRLEFNPKINITENGKMNLGYHLVYKF